MSHPKYRPGANLLRESGVGAIGATFAMAAALAFDMALAFVLGAGATTDALFVAMRIPLGVILFFRPTAIQVLVPAIAGWKLKGTPVVNSHTGAVALATAVLTGTLAVTGVVAAPLLVMAQAPGLSTDSLDLAADLARLAFAFMPMAATAEVFRAYRHAGSTHGLASALHGIVGLTAVLGLVIAGGRADAWVALWGYAIGVCLELALAIALARSSGFRFVGCRRSFSEVKIVGRRSARPLAASAIQLGTRIVEQSFASFLAPGSITILTYANRLVGAVGGTLVFQPIVVTVLTHMSRLFAEKRIKVLRRLLTDGLRVLIVASLSLSALVVMGGSRFVTGLFALGDLGAEQATALGIVVAVYAASLPTAAMQRLLLGATFARLETRTYFRNTAYGSVVNVALLVGLSLLWTGDWPLVVVPLAYSIAQLVNVGHATLVVRSWLGPAIWPGKELVSPLAIVAFATGAMAVTSWVLVPSLGNGPWALLAQGLVISAVGMVVILVGLVRVAPGPLRSALRWQIGDELVSPRPG